MNPPAASRLLCEALEECRRSAGLLARLLDESAEMAPTSPHRAPIAAGIERLALRARLLSLDARLEGLLRPGMGHGFVEVARELGALADRCEEVAVLVRAGPRGATHLGAKLALRTSLMAPPAMRPSTTS